MELKNIKPFVRFSRFLKVSQNSFFPELIPLDARLFYVENGEGKIKVDNKLFIMPPHSLLFIHSGQKYLILPCDVLYNVINFDFTEHFADMEEPIPPLSDAESSEKQPLENITFSDAACFDKYSFLTDLLSLQTYFSRIKDSYERKLSFYRLETSTLLSFILLKVAQKHEIQFSKEGRFDVQKIVEYIHNHYNEEINNSVLSEVFHFHPNYISSELKKSTGKSLHNYVLEVRVLKAIALVESGTKSMSEIANVCGFKNSNYFARYFKKKTGLSPGEFRNPHKNTR